uniref:(northern house mosquito) hypothetical protein n=1 Tax=Culex pipiens TaxID=7175 RepID=A0A8D8GZJ3_CULPI
MPTAPEIACVADNLRTRPNIPRRMTASHKFSSSLCHVFLTGSRCSFIKISLFSPSIFSSIPPSSWNHFQERTRRNRSCTPKLRVAAATTTTARSANLHTKLFLSLSLACILLLQLSPACSGTAEKRAAVTIGLEVRGTSFCDV